jgi:hypothetical protein
VCTWRRRQKLFAGSSETYHGNQIIDEALENFLR